MSRLVYSQDKPIHELERSVLLYYGTRALLPACALPGPELLKKWQWGGREYGVPEVPGIDQRAKYDAERDSIRATSSGSSYTVTTVVRHSAGARAALRGVLDEIARAGGGEVEGYPARHTGREDDRLTSLQRVGP